MKKKAHVLVLILMVIIAMALSACQGKGSTTGNNADNGSVGSSSETSGGNGSLSEPGKLPLVDKKTTITITVPRSANILDYEYGKNDLTTWLEDQTNVHVKWNLYPSADAEQKLNLELSSGGNLGDLIMGDFGFDNTTIASYASQGVLQPLNDLIDKDGFYIKKIFDEHPEMKKGTTAPDGNIYSMNKVGNCFNCDRAMRFWVNQDFLNALHMSMPTTTDELHQYLKAVKEKDPNGNGKQDEIPLTGSPKGWFTGVTDFIMNAFTYNDGEHHLFVDDNGKIQAAYSTDGWKQGLGYLHQLYSEGLLDASSFTNDTDQMTQTVELNGGDTVGAAPGGTQPGTNDATKLKYVIVPPLKGPSGFQFAYYNEYGAVSDTKFLLPANGKNKDLVMKWIDFMYSDDAGTRSRWGVPGVNWKKPEGNLVAANGGTAQMEPITTDQQQNSYWWDGANFVYSPFSSDSRARLPEGQYDIETSLYDAAKQYDPYTKKGKMVPPFYFGSDAAKKYNDLQTQIEKYVDSATAEFIVGKRNVDSDWEDYLSNLKKMGIDEYMQIMQDAYDKDWK